MDLIARAKTGSYIIYGHLPNLSKSVHKMFIIAY